MAETLKIALVHLAVEFQQPETNRRRLLELNRRAAAGGARIIVNTEAGLSGYGFDSRSEMAAMAETADGPTLKALSRLAREQDVYICAALAELDPATELVYNSAFLLGPDGRIQCRRRKVTAETKWACPGEPRQEDVCDTPWGRVGLLICSETYFGIFVRQLALKGADLVLVPANWPAGGLEPRELWGARALENGLALAVCNRAGQDRRMDCSRSSSCLFDAEGNILLAGQSQESKVFFAELPLEGGRLPQGQRRARLSARSPGWYHYLAADVRLSMDLTSLYDLPQPGKMEVGCLALRGKDRGSPRAVERGLPLTVVGQPRLLILPALQGDGFGPEWLAGLARERDAAVCVRLDEALAFAWPGGQRVFPLNRPRRRAQEPLTIDYGPARIGLAAAEDLLHPELAMALAKRGCDLVAAMGGAMSEAEQTLLKVRAYDKIAVAAALGDAAFVCLPPEGHARFVEKEVRGAGLCSQVLDTTGTRSKSFPDRLDYQLLLSKEAPHA